MEPEKHLRKHNISINTSCDESQAEQKIDDDKIELMSHTQVIDFIDGRMGRLGQVRSPFTVDFNKDFETQGRTI